MVVENTFNELLVKAGYSLKDVRLLRHQDKSADKDKTPYLLWNNNRPKFEWYQATQSFWNRPRLDAPFWAAFVVDFSGRTIFVGLYRVSNRRPLEKDSLNPHCEGINKAGSCDQYDFQLENAMQKYIGKLVIDWGAGKLAWIQRADKQKKQIVEL
jgi:hypothetical protein